MPHAQCPMPLFPNFLNTHFVSFSIYVIFGITRITYLVNFNSQLNIQHCEC
ncbi:hypothetical protein H6G33_21385 [Calothrix sp. FACHB-1219]|uniref:hypothetical protein n=1 Tax=unclassified Calothrix TaxID=2619626 RepID=UPI001683DE36|nr:MULTISPECIES: hypothetical protein [unclassified Calothrix]MBD2203753.1 hypothetical protein [Calothrix sp. FACHB-168]MBD2219573.1 hypothetical protein [Calothrix sp. FACHB-1219]